MSSMSLATEPRFETKKFSTPASDWQVLSKEQMRSALAGSVSVEETSEGLVPWRLRFQDRAFIHEGLLPRVLCTSGVHLRLRTGASGLRVSLTTRVGTSAFATGDAKFDLWVNGSEWAACRVPEAERVYLTFDALPEGEKILDFYFPLNLSVCLHSVEISEGAELLDLPVLPKWVTHGSSITHCRAAQSPAYTWPAIVARERGWDAWNMGYGGQCKFDPIVARTIRDMPADRISLCLGINTNTPSFAMRTWLPAVEGFIMTVRDGHPETPLLVISPILSPPREDLRDDVMMVGLKVMRETLADVVSRFQAAGDANIHYMDGLQIIGPGDEGTMPDELHPDAEGIKLMARRFLERAPDGWMAAGKG